MKGTGKDMRPPMAAEAEVQHVEFTVCIEEDEPYVLQRLQSEKGCGSVEQVSGRVWRFTADVYDTGEIIPWIRTFICRIITIDFSNRNLENQFRRDLQELYRMYGLMEEEACRKQAAGPEDNAYPMPERVREKLRRQMLI